ncbi:HAD family hydrolase [Bacillus thuringiensis]|uniref:HAD family hydrolase n=1 Tax=Bacillus thuringiensis TaxID=1428 RepID=UPI000BF7B180|nr:HAD family hydrolase [Bacillus thuringiensis]PEY73220.1 hypothetical protein CN355_11300 [Bacillus thuringiensis]
MSWLIFDLDDTLVITSAVYEEARNTFATRMKQLQLGEQEETLKLLNEIDWKNRKTMDVAKNRLAISMHETYCTLTKRAGRLIDIAMRDECFKIMEKVFKHRYRLVWGANKLLSECMNRGYRMVLYTRGDQELQERKIRETKIEKYFEHIEIAPSKDKERLRNLLQSLNIEPEYAWMIGDEILTDVKHGLAVGMNVVRVWGYHEKEPAILPETKRCKNVKSLNHVLPILNQEQLIRDEVY